ncbi:HesA/MoeB/ThiF family protein [Shewanella maritima]|uniref:HesA/MoeB/ThiF family protein n=1 Tax=Shewanella maritima TaxID=2520507 RepID=A0A411PMG3_9GAMM|nr:HesA/MoeB/ThiF family protein [Shewanella maritima]QBF84713.1 HesA/MoeB/ThiF family protein [Shewanella maritima]
MPASTNDANSSGAITSTTDSSATIASTDRTKLTDKQFIEFSRQIFVEDFGELGQENLLNAKVLIIGAGGLGAQVAHQLVAAGVGAGVYGNLDAKTRINAGHIKLVDGDLVETSNIPRQLLFSMTDVGENKAKTAANRLNRQYQNANVRAVSCDLAADKLEHIFSDGCELDGYDLVIDCTDNLKARHLINELCVTHKLTLLSGAVAGNDGQVFCLDFDCKASQTTNGIQKAREHDFGCYQCLVPKGSTTSQSCSAIGVLGPTVSHIASTQAMFAISHLAGTFNHYGQLFRFQANPVRWLQMTLTRDSKCSVCCSKG